jgi:putative ribosome biogenesis GTPase RsgA
MKNKVTNGLLFLCLMLMLIACNSKKTEPVAVVDKEQIKKEIQAKENEFAETYNSGEVKILAIMQKMQQHLLKTKNRWLDGKQLLNI